MSDNIPATPKILRRKASAQKLKEVGARLIWLRETMGYTQTEFAEYLHLRVEMLNRWERGTRQPNLDLLCIVCEKTEATLDFILGGRVGPAMNDELVRKWIADQMTDPSLAAALQRAISRLRIGFVASLAAVPLPAAQDYADKASSIRPSGKGKKPTNRKH